jgi:uncharacterized protein YjbJ (UPF0337 family)
MSKTREKAEGFTRQVIGQMIGDDLLVQEGKELEQKANEEDKSENVTGQRQQPSKERSRQPPSRKDESDS